jgi:hypothetical protein
VARGHQHHRQRFVEAAQAAGVDLHWLRTATIGVTAWLEFGGSPCFDS